MNDFTVLHTRISDAQRALEQARNAGHEHEVHLHSARLLDLIDRAVGLGADVSGWVHPAVLSIATQSRQ